MKLSIVAGLGILLVLSACESRVQPTAEQSISNTSAVAQSLPHKKQAKPGADIRLVNPAPINLVPGQTGSLELELATSKTSGTLQVEIHADEGLMILSQPAHLEFALTSRGSYAIPLQVMAQTQGRFYLHLQASLKTQEQTLGRSLSVAVQVGDALKAQVQQQKMAQSSSTSSDAVISVPAQETISSP